MRWHTIKPNATAIEDDDMQDSDDIDKMEGIDRTGLPVEEVTELLRAHGHDPDAPFRAGGAKFDPIHLDLPKETSFSMQPPLSRTANEALDTVVADWLEQGVIEAAAPGKFSSPLLPVKKKGKLDSNGRQAYRGVLNLKRVNRLIKKQRYQTANIPSLLQQVAGNKKQTRYFTSIDISQFFFNFRLDESSRAMFAFTHRGRSYRQKVMSMGSCLASPITSHLLAQALEGLLNVFVYCDDIVIACTTKAELLDLTSKLLQRLADFGFSVNASKTLVAATTVVFAGHEISGGQISVSPAHKRAFADWPEPTTKTQLQRFVHTTQWLSTHCPRFATSAAILERRLDVTRTTVTLNEDERAAFTTIKRHLTSDTFLSPFDNDRDLNVWSDASDVATGVVLTQADDDGGTRILGYHSHKFTRAELNFSVREKELLAVMRASERFESFFLTTTKVTIFTDHKSLETIISSNNQQSQRLERWTAHLSRFNINFVYRPAAQLTVPDAISRMDLNTSKRVLDGRRADAEGGEEAEEEAGEATESAATTSDDNAGAPTTATTAAHLRAHEPEADGAANQKWQPPNCPIPELWRPQLCADYATDPYFAEAYELAASRNNAQTPGALADVENAATTEARARTRWLTRCDNGLLWNTAVDNQPRLVLPDGPTRARLLNEVHANVGHVGHDALTAMLRDIYFFPAMADTIATMAASCEACARGKPKTTATGTSNSHSRPQQRLQSLVTDVFSGLNDIAGYTQVLLTKDILTGTVALSPLSPNADSNEIIAAFETSWARVYGFPKEIHLDRAGYFTSRTFARYCNNNDIKLSFAVANHHVASAERAIRSAREKIRTMAAAHGNWLAVLPLCELAMNRAVSRHDGMSANQRLFGFNVAMPLLPAAAEAATTTTDGRDRSAHTLVSLIDSFYDTRERTARWFDHGRTPSNIRVGSWVYVKRELVKLADSPFDNNKAAKTRNPFVGPYRVAADESNGNWRLDGFENARLDPVFHESTLKLHGKLETPAPVQKGPRHGDMFWPDGIPRVREVMAKRSWYGTTQYLVKHHGSSAEDPGVWSGPSQLHFVDHQKITAFDPSFERDSLKKDLSLGFQLANDE